MSLVDLPAGVGRVGSKVRWRVLSPELDVLDEIHPLSEPAPTISVQQGGAVQRTCRGFELNANEARELDPFKARLQPVWEYEDGSSYNMGVFMLSSPVRLKLEGNTRFQDTLVDQGFALNQPMSYGFGVWSGGRIYDALVRLVEEAGIVKYRIDPSDEKVGGAVNWPIGTVRLQIFKALCELAGFLPPYFDNDGWLVIRAPSEPTQSDAIEYRVDQSSRIYRGTVAERDNVVDAPNVYIVVSNSPSRTELVGRADVDPRLPHSIPNRGGLEVPKVIRMQGVRDTDHANRIAQQHASRDPFQLATVQFTSAPDPRHDVFTRVQYEGEIWNEERFDIQTRPGGDHTHSITKQVLFVDEAVVA